MPTKPTYYSLDQLLEMIDPPNAKICQQILAESRELFRAAPGSTHNHQAWEGGYWDHVVEAMNLWLVLYAALEQTGRLDQLIPSERFTSSDGLLILFLHDLEKPWRNKLVDGQLVVKPELASWEARHKFAQDKLEGYGIRLTPVQQNAFKFVEGIRSEDYSSSDRVALPLAAVCHCCDHLSARAFYDFPLAEGDSWAPGRLH